MASRKKTAQPSTPTTVGVELWGSLKVEGNMAGGKVVLSRLLLPGESVVEAFTKLIEENGEALTKSVNRAFNAIGVDDVIAEE